MAAATQTWRSSSKKNEHIQITIVDDCLLQVVIRRENKLNALTSGMYAAMAEAFKLASSDDNIVALLLTGSGKAFTAGADVSSPSNSELPLHQAPVSDFMHAMIDCQVPIFIAVNGAAVGIGVTMLPHADVVIADPAAYFALPFLRNAIVPEFASTKTLPEIVGPAVAGDMLYTGRRLTAHEAATHGLVSRISAPGAALELALRLATGLAKQPLASKSARIFREMMRKHDRDYIHELIAWELKALDERLQNGDAAAAVMQWWSAKHGAGTSKL